MLFLLILEELLTGGFLLKGDLLYRFYGFYWLLLLLADLISLLFGLILLFEIYLLLFEVYLLLFVLIEWLSLS